MAALHPTAPQCLPSNADEHMVDLLASDLIVAVPAPVIDVLALKPGTSKSQTIVMADTGDSI